MKIGILSMNYTKNYGGILQTYGLYQYLQSKGHDVYVINYKNSGKKTLQNYISKGVSILTSLSLKKDESSQRYPQQLTQRYLEKFVEFRKRMNYTPLVDEFSIADVCKELDVVVVGSDQIWNDINSNKLVFYFDWKFYGKKIAYAACTILRKSPVILRRKIKNLLKSFDTITVRDRNTCNFVVSNGLGSPKQVVDPTCLYGYKEFIAGNPIGESYILTYILSSEITGGLDNALSMIKEHVGNLKVVSVSIPCESTIAKRYSDVFLDEASPEEWVNLFANASFVLTDSFHGIMFSLKFRKPFIAYCKEKNRASRLQDIIKTYDLHNIIDNTTSIPYVFDSGIIDYSSVMLKLNECISNSEKILDYAL